MGLLVNIDSSSWVTVTEAVEMRMQLLNVPVLEREVEHLRVLVKTKDSDSKVCYFRFFVSCEFVAHSRPQ